MKYSPMVMKLLFVFNEQKARSQAARVLAWGATREARQDASMILRAKNWSLAKRFFFALAG